MRGRARLQVTRVAIWIRAAVSDERARQRRADRHVRFGERSYSHGPINVLVYPGDPDGIITVGAYTSIAADVTCFVGGEHHTDWLTTYPFEAAFALGHPMSRGPITIGSDVWIGTGVTIRSGVIIGDGAIIGAKSVVTADIPPYTIVGGAPARTLRRRFDDETIRRLLELRWWEWSARAVDRAQAILCSGDIEALEAYARSL
jgi:acetyltransferase-like isoleucine patch superfamily enzyme